MMFYTGKWEAEPDVRSVPLGKSIKRGRPKINPHCLTKSPIRTEQVAEHSVGEQTVDIDLDDTPAFSCFTMPTDENTVPIMDKQQIVDVNDNSDDNSVPENDPPINKKRKREVKRIPSVANSNEPEDEIIDIPQLLKNSKPPIKTATQSKRRKVLR